MSGRRAGKPFIGLCIGSLNRDDQGGRRSYPVADLLQACDIGIVLRQELCEVGAKLQAGGGEDREAKENEASPSNPAVVARQKSHVSAHEARRFLHGFSARHHLCYLRYNGLQLPGAIWHATVS